MHMQNAKVFLRHPDVLPSWRGLQSFVASHADMLCLRGTGRMMGVGLA